MTRATRCACFAVALFAGSAVAEPPGGSSMRARARSGEIKGVEEISEELVIVGKIQKPEVFYVLGRSEFAYRGMKLKRSFVDEIKRSVRDNPF